MEKEKILRPELEVIDEPHFEEAWTVLAARPVVPLKKIESHDLWKKLKLVTAFIGASLLGVVVALASIRIQRSASVEGDTPASVTEMDSPSQSGPAQDAPGDAGAAEQTAIVPEVNAAPMAKKTPSHPTEATKHQSVKTPTSLEDIRSEVIDPNASQPELTDEWQERRQRRITVRRHRRDVDDLHHRDLMRIQEIFEGRRPRN